MAHTDIERKLSTLTKQLEGALQRLEDGDGNYDEVQRLEREVNELYQKLEEENKDG